MGPILLAVILKRPRLAWLELIGIASIANFAADIVFGDPVFHAAGLSLANTVLSAVIAGGMGVLAASLAQLDATTLPLQVVPALGAVLFARFTS